MALTPALQKFTTASPVIASYSKTELLSGIAYAETYAGATKDKKILSNISFYGAPTSTKGYLSSTDIDVDFDVTINMATTFEGTAILNIPEAIKLADDNGHCSFVANLYKVVEGEETLIVTKSGASFEGTNNELSYRNECLALTIPLTTIGQGELLRLNITGSGVTGGNPNQFRYFKLGHDPKNRTTGWDSTGVNPSILILQLPVRTDI